MTYNFKKHYHDPFCQLREEWKTKITCGTISIADAAALSGFSRQYIYGVVRRGELQAIANLEGKKYIDWKKFVLWYSNLPETPESPIGSSSYSLKKLMEYTGFGRCWALRFAERYHIPSYYVALSRRFDKQSVISAWKQESVIVKKWLNIEEATSQYDMTPLSLFIAVGQHRIQTTQQNNQQLYRVQDIKRIMQKGVIG